MGVIQTFVFDLMPGEGLFHYVLVFLGINVLAVGIYFLFELPVNKWMRRRLVSAAERANARTMSSAVVNEPQPTRAA